MQTAEVYKSLRASQKSKIQNSQNFTFSFFQKFECWVFSGSDSCKPRSLLSWSNSPQMFLVSDLVKRENSGLLKVFQGSLFVGRQSTIGTHLILLNSKVTCCKRLKTDTAVSQKYFETYARHFSSASSYQSVCKKYLVPWGSEANGCFRTKHSVIGMDHSKNILR